jgi:hypothetical protein
MPKYKKGETVLYFDEEFVVVDVMEEDETSYLIQGEDCKHIVQENEINGRST